MAKSARRARPRVDDACRLLPKVIERDPGNPMIFDLASQYCRGRATEEMAGALHDLRSPNCSIRLNLATARRLAESLTDASLTRAQIADIAHSLSACIKAIEISGELEGDILDSVTPLPEGACQEPQVATLRDAIGRTRAVACSQCLPEDLVVVQQIPDVQVAASVGDLLRVLLNLVRNAVAAIAGSACPRVEISSWVTPAAAFVRVEDNGCGMDARRQGPARLRLFTTKPVGGGLGLSSVRRCVERWGGQMDVRSTPGEGTQIVFSIPLAKEAQRAAGEAD